MKSLDFFPGYKTYALLAIGLFNYLDSQWPEIVDGTGLIRAGVAILVAVAAGATKRMADLRNSR